MSSETKCPGCGRLLRVADEHAGKQARCPVCNTIYVVPGSADRRLDAASDPADRWYMKTPEGQAYGPVARVEIERWLAEGRISAECQLRVGEDAPWRPADEVFGVLSRKPPVPQGSNPFAERSVPSATTATVARQYHVPHRGGLVLALGIVGWFTCPLFSVMAWVMGSSDLREMRYGRMDPGGIGLTQAGYYLGMIYTLLWMVILLIFIGVGLLMLMAGALS